MKHEIINIDVGYGHGVSNSGSTAAMSVYLADNAESVGGDKKRPTVIICPGGAYESVLDREAEPVALKFLAEDCNAIVLRYSVAPTRFPVALFQLSYAVALARENSDRWSVDPDRIAVCGFEAGGHLAASFSTHWNKGFVRSFFGYDNGENKPNGMILCCPVVTTGSFGHKKSFANLLGKDADDELRELVCVEKNISSKTPPAFIWHAFDDKSVNIKNSLLLADALSDNNIPTELHIHPNGANTLTVENEVASNDAQVWIDTAIRWLKNL